MGFPVLIGKCTFHMPCVCIYIYLYVCMYDTRRLICWAFSSKKTNWTSHSHGFNGHVPVERPGREKQMT